MDSFILNLNALECTNGTFEITVERITLLSRICIILMTSS